MYRIDLENLVRNKLYICKEYHIQPSEIDRMMYFDYETMLEEIKQIQTNQEKENEKQQEQYDNVEEGYADYIKKNNINTDLNNLTVDDYLHVLEENRKMYSYNA